ncbi:phosphomevalonate kinase [Leptidea sinapis]|uniref:phosphomevalonate kinase n=1 Tax=Leptidea sinapis TaxID=189913 RepID=UPI00214491F9|nr:phosphomevalonate kinase [Leptidea sinapis]
MPPKIILLFSGKRKCGKDFITDQLKERLGDNCEIIKISMPIKSYWAKEMNLNLNDLLSDNSYKEQYRLDMINWSEKKRNENYGCFCEAACEEATVKPIWIVSDIRRKTDIKWFQETFGKLIRTIRLEADDNTREERGFKFKVGVDDADSECGLDNYEDWDLVINNGKGRKSVNEQIEMILRLIDSC